MYFIVDGNTLFRSSIEYKDICEIYRQFKNDSELCRAIFPSAFYETLSFNDNRYDFEPYELEKKFAIWSYERVKQLYSKVKRYWNKTDSEVIDEEQQEPEESQLNDYEPVPDSTISETTQITAMNEECCNQFAVFKKRRNYFFDTYYEGFEMKPIKIQDNTIAEEQLMVIMYNTNKFAILHSKLANVINNLNAIGIKDVRIDYVWWFPNINLVYDLAEYYKLDDVLTVFKIYKALKTKENKGIIYKWFLDYALKNYEFDHSSSVDFKTFYKHFMESKSNLNLNFDENSIRDIMMYFNMHIKDQKILYIKQLAKPRGNIDLKLSDWDLMYTKPKITQLRMDPNVVLDKMMSSQLNI